MSRVPRIDERTSLEDLAALVCTTLEADTECLVQAIQVAMRHPVDLKRIERWARGERPHGEERFREFERRLRESAGA